MNNKVINEKPGICEFVIAVGEFGYPTIITKITFTKPIYLKELISGVVFIVKIDPGNSETGISHDIANCLPLCYKMENGSGAP